MPFASTCRGQMHLMRRGAGRPDAPSTVLVHGAGGRASLWGAVLGRLRGVESIAIDLPGHGRSPGPVRCTVQAYADDILAAAGALGLPSFVAAGHSLGGAIALELALRAPSCVRALILMAVGAHSAHGPALRQLAEDPELARRWIVETAYGPEIPGILRRLATEQLALLPARVLQQDLVAYAGFDVRARLDQVHCPALVLCGSADRLTPPGHARALAAGLPAAQFELWPGAGHMLPLERPQQVAEAASRFLSTLQA